MQHQPQQSDVSMLIFRIETLEKDVERLSMQLSNYVPQRENDLKLQSIQEIVRRIEAEVVAAKQQLSDMNTKLTTQEMASRDRDQKEQEKRDKIQIDTLRYIVITIVGLAVMVIGGVVVYFLTHPGG